VDGFLLHSKDPLLDQKKEGQQCTAEFRKDKDRLLKSSIRSYVIGSCSYLKKKKIVREYFHAAKQFLMSDSQSLVSSNLIYHVSMVTLLIYVNLTAF